MTSLRSCLTRNLGGDQGLAKARIAALRSFQDRNSMDRLLFVVFMHENRNQGIATPFPLTETS